MLMRQQLLSRDQVRDPRSEHFCFARTRARQDHQRTFGDQHGLALPLVQVLEDGRNIDLSLKAIGTGLLLCGGWL